MAVETTAQLVTQVQTEYGFDSDATVVLGWLNQKHRRMVARSECYRDTATATTVADQSVYTLDASIIRLLSLGVDGYPWPRVRPDEIDHALTAWDSISGLSTEGGVWSQATSAANVEQIRLYPTPTSSGLTISMFAAVRAPELVSGGQAPVIPAEFYEDLVAGAAALGMRREEERMNEAQALDQQFDQACNELARQTKKKLRSSPARIKVAWP